VGEKMEKKKMEGERNLWPMCLGLLVNVSNVCVCFG